MEQSQPYADYKSRIRPLDLVCFCGGDPVSALIRKIQRTQSSESEASGGKFSHSGVIVTTDVLSHPKMKPGRLYILESTATGLLGCGVKNIENKAFFGVQLTDFDKLVEAYDSSDRTRIAVAHLNVGEEARRGIGQKLQAFWEQMRGRSYEFNLFTMLSAALPFLRRWRRQVEKVVGGEDWVFCSQLACMTYQACGLLPSEIESKDVLPEDLLGLDADHAVPLIFQLPPVYLLNRRRLKQQRRQSK